MKPHMKLSAIVLLSIGLVSASASYALPIPTVIPNADTAAQGFLASQMARHQQEMETLYQKLQASYAAVLKAESEDKSWTRTPPALKAAIREHRENLQELRTAVREHKLLAEDYKAACSGNPEAVKAMTEHQIVMKSVLYDLVDSFDRVLTMPDDINYDMLDVALTDHRAAMREFERAIEQHKEDIDKYAGSCQR